MSGAETTQGLETRRADDALYYLLRKRAVSGRRLHVPEAAGYHELGRVHTSAYLDSLQDPETLASIFATDASDIYVDELMRTVRLACGGTIAAARTAVARNRLTLNLLGGFHHAAPGRGAGFCPVNDVAVAIAALRAEGFGGSVAVLDLDFHPPDGTAECLRGDTGVWLGSLSGTDWGPLPGVDETVLPEGTGDADYLDALTALLGRMPEADLTFVLAGADVLAGDRLGTLALSLPGVRRRDLQVARHLGSRPQVWLPAGGYSGYAWKVLAGVGIALAHDSDEPIPLDYDPLASRMSRIARSLTPQSLGDGAMLTDADLSDLFGGGGATGPRRLLGFYTAQGMELALERYGMLPHLRRLGFRELAVMLDRVGAYDRARVVGTDVTSGQQVTLVELEAERRRVGTGTFLFVNWLSLRNPRARFTSTRPQLPGQEVPGLGMAREMTQLLRLMARRLHLDGVAFRPSWYHMAFAARHGSRFEDPARQGRFEALMRDLRDVPLIEATHALAGGRVLLDGAPYVWEPDEMVSWLTPPEVDDAEEVARVRESSHFTLAPGPVEQAAGQG